MPIDVVCPQCQKTLRVGDHVAGKKIRYPWCQGVVAVREMMETLTEEPPVRIKPVKTPSENPARATARPKRSAKPPDEETPWDSYDSYGSDAIPEPQGSRTVQEKKGSTESPTDKLIRRHSTESTAALAIASAWCAMLSVIVLLFLKRGDVDDFEKVRSTAYVYLGLSGFIVVVLVLQLLNFVPLLYVSMVMIGVVGALFSLIVVSGEWLMIVSSIGCFISLQRMKSVARMLQDR